MVGQILQLKGIRSYMEVETVNHKYGLYAWGRITTIFETKEDVEDYLRVCGNIVSCYNPNKDSWTTSGDFQIFPIADIFTYGIPVYRKQNES